MLVVTKTEHLNYSNKSTKYSLGNELEKKLGYYLASFLNFDEKKMDGSFSLEKGKRIIYEK